MNKIEVFSLKNKKVIYIYNWIKEINDEMLTMAKVESVLDERPKYMTQDSIDACIKTFDQYFYLIINNKKL